MPTCCTASTSNPAIRSWNPWRRNLPEATFCLAWEFSKFFRKHKYLKDPQSWTELCKPKLPSSWKNTKLTPDVLDLKWTDCKQQDWLQVLKACWASLIFESGKRNCCNDFDFARHHWRIRTDRIHFADRDRSQDKAGRREVCSGVKVLAGLIVSVDWNSWKGNLSD